MKDFIINLYANKYFPIYLGVVIIVLLIAFFIVFFLGKKDQKKIEETQKLNLEKLKDIQNNTVVTNNEVKTSVPVQNTPAQPVISAPEVKPVTVNEPIQTPVAPVNEVKTAPVVEPVKVTPVMEVKKDIVVEPPVKEVPPVIPPVMETYYQSIDNEEYQKNHNSYDNSVNVRLHLFYGIKILTIGNIKIRIL